MAVDASMQVAGVIENMSTTVCASCGAQTAVFGEGGAHLADQLGVPLLGQVPLDVRLREAGDSGTPAVLREPDSPSSRELRRIAAALPSNQPSLAGRPLPLFPT